MPFRKVSGCNLKPLFHVLSLFCLSHNLHLAPVASFSQAGSSTRPRSKPGVALSSCPTVTVRGGAQRLAARNTFLCARSRTGGLKCLERLRVNATGNGRSQGVCRRHCSDSGNGSISGQGRAEIERAGFLHRPLFWANEAHCFSPSIRHDEIHHRECLRVFPRPPRAWGGSTGPAPESAVHVR
jgi:hypothetical protein